MSTGFPLSSYALYYLLAAIISTALCPRVVCADDMVQAACPFRYAFGTPAELPPLQSLVKKNDVVIRGDQLTQHGKTLFVAGHVTLTHWDTSLRTSSLTYDQASSTLTAAHDFQLQLQDGNVLLYAEEGIFHIQQETGELKNVRYKIRKVRSAGGHPISSYGTGHARFLHITKPNYYLLEGATYSTCPSNQKQWFISAESILIDVDNNDASIKNAIFHFHGTPILFLPHLSMPLSPKKRRSGFLAPTYTQNSLNGIQLIIPYYFNSAPNYDLLLIPIFLQKRGVTVQELFRLLTQKSTIEARLEYLHQDKIVHTRRYAYLYRSYTRWDQHTTTTLDVNHVSDNTYLTDIPNQIGHDSNVLLPQNMTNTWIQHDSNRWMRYQFILQHYQLAAPHDTQFIDEPYDLWPRLSAHITRYDPHHTWIMDLDTEITRFQRHRQLAGWRLWLYPQISWLQHTGPLYLTPKAAIHLNTYYHATAGPPIRHQQVSIPVLSVRATTQLERSLPLFGHRYLQTLEPQAYYLYIPYRPQNHCPLFDTRPGVISFPTIFGENGLLGKDRVLDANQVTWGMTTRFLHATSGHEYFAATLAQRLYFTDTHLSLPPVARTPLPNSLSSPAPWQHAMHTAHASDWLASVSSDVNEHIAIDGLLQVGTEKKGNHQGVQLLSLATRYRMDPTHLLNIGYQYDHFGPTQIMLSGQTPLSRHWHAVGSVNYTLRDNTYNVHKKNFVSEGTLGLQYINCCWAVHISMTYSRSPSAKPVKTFFLQFELGGLALIGPNITQLLKSRVPGYHSVTDAGSFFDDQGSAPLD